MTEKKLAGAGAILLIVTLCLPNFIDASDYPLLIVANELYQSFPNETTGVNFILSGSTIFMTIGSVVAPVFLRAFDKKLVLGLACAVTGCAGFCTLMPANVWAMVAIRCVMAFGQGVTTVAELSVIAAIFTENEGRRIMTGYFTAVSPIAAALLNYVAGLLAAQNWRMVTTVFLVSIPVVIMIALVVPSLSPSGCEEEQRRGSLAGGDGFGAAYWVLILLVLVFFLADYFMVYFLSVYVAELDLGDAALVGAVSAAGMIGASVGAWLFGRIGRWVGEGAPVLSCVMAIGSFAGFWLIHGVLTTFVFNVLLQMGMGILIAYAYSEVPTLVAPSKVDWGISFVALDVSLPGFCVSFIVTALMNRIGGGRFVPVLPVPLALMVACLVLAEIGRRMSPGKG